MALKNPLMESFRPLSSTTAVLFAEDTGTALDDEPMVLPP
jgi:hypothetical protein